MATEELGGLQAPHVTRWGPSSAPRYHMFYGTWSSIAQATSVDGKIFTRSLDSNGRAPIFQQDSNHSNTRDPMLFRVSAQPGLDVMHLVYSSYPNVGPWGAQDGVWARTISLDGSAYSNDDAYKSGDCDAAGVNGAPPAPPPPGRPALHRRTAPHTARVPPGHSQGQRHQPRCPKRPTLRALPLFAPYHRGVGEG